MSVFRIVEKIIALTIAIGYVVAMILSAHVTTTATVICSLGLLVPVACIWFPEELGSCTDIYVNRGQTLDAETPAGLVSAMGWILLVGLPALFLWLSR